MSPAYTDVRAVRNNGCGCPRSNSTVSDSRILICLNGSVRKRPYRYELLCPAATVRPMEYCTSSAVMQQRPVWKRTPWRKWKTQTDLSALLVHDVASMGTY